MIQTSHVTDEELVKNELFSNSLWKYIRETSEWIPIFEFSNDNKINITDIVDLSISELNKRYFTTDSWWATPKGFPRLENE